MVSRNPPQDCLSNGCDGQANMIWRCNTISFASKFKLFRSLVTSILLCGCETWTMLADSEFFLTRLSKQVHLFLGAHDQRLGVGHDQLPCGSTGTSSGNCQETETCMVRVCHMARQPVQNHPSGHLGGWATPWSAEEKLD